MRALLVLGLAAASIYAAAAWGRGAALLAGGIWLVGLGFVLVWLPRAAHRAFEAGNFGRAMLLYRILRRFLFDPGARASVDVSRAACALARGDCPAALRILDRIATDDLNEAARAAWLNNRAYALARNGDDCSAALEHSDESIALRPDVAGFRHTRGLALLGLGRIDEAIRELDGLWSDLAGDETVSLLEAERCYDLAVAWTKKGEHDYAIDYFERARRAAPDSSWATRAAEELTRVPALRSPPVLAEFIEG